MTARGVRPGDRNSRRYFYAAGEPSLVTEVETYLRQPGTLAMRGAKLRDVISIEGKGLTWPALQGHLTEPAMHAGERLVIIREADKVPPPTWLALSYFLARPANTPRSLYLLASAPGDYKTIWPRKDPKDSRVAIFVEHRHGLYVECKPLDADGQEAYVRGKLGARLPTHLAADLVRRCGGDLTRLKGETEKLGMVAGPGRLITERLLEEVVVVPPGDQFVEALVVGDKATAAARAPYVGSTHAVLARLEWRLSALYLIRTAVVLQGNKASLRTISTYTGLPIYAVMQLRRFARTYDARTVAERYRAILQAARLMRSIGDDPAPILVPLVARW